MKILDLNVPDFCFLTLKSCAFKSRFPTNLKMPFAWSYLKGILHQKNFYRLNLIFWIVMGFGIARFGLKGLKTAPWGFEGRRH